jgi:hypothetical protein
MTQFFNNHPSQATLATMERDDEPHRVTAEELDALMDDLSEGVVSVGIHDDNSTEMFDVGGASETMFEAAAAIRSLRAELTELRLELIATSGQAGEHYDARIAAEAERDRLRDALASEEADHRKRHVSYITSKGRDPDKYGSVYSTVADAILRAMSTKPTIR